MNKKQRAILLRNAPAYQFCLQIKDGQFEVLIEHIYKELDKHGCFPAKGLKGKLNAGNIMEILQGQISV